MKKYKFSPNDYFEVPVNQLIANKVITFPLFIYFEQNDHLMKRYLEEHFLTEQSIFNHIKSGIQKFYCPNNFKKNFEEYLYNQETIETTPIFNETPESSRDEVLSTFAQSLINNEILKLEDDKANYVLDIIDAEGISLDVKKSSINKLCAEALSEIVEFDEINNEKYGMQFSKVFAFSNTIIKANLKNHALKTVYDDAISIQTIAESPHSIATTTYSILFALALGYIDSESICDLTFASLFHDLGLTEFSQSIAQTPQLKLSEIDKSHYEQHIFLGIKILESRGILLTAQSQTLIEQHHERFNGTGYPAKLSGDQINKLSTILALSDFIDDLQEGKIDGQIRTAKQIFNIIQALPQSSVLSTYFCPEITKNIANLTNLSKIIYKQNHEYKKIEAKLKEQIHK